MTFSMIFVYIATIDFLLLTKYLNLHYHDLVPVVLDKKDVLLYPTKSFI